MSVTKTGGCQCGAVRYEAVVQPDKAYLCHCRMCQRATGGVAAAFINCKIADRRWTAAEPDYYQSSPIARRPYCARCGTPLGFEFLEGEICDITIGTFDDPSDFRPSSHFSSETIHEAWLDTSGLERKRLDEYKPLQDRWKKAGAEPPE